jgi:alpha-L-fucosidase
MKKAIFFSLLGAILSATNLNAQQKYEADWASIDSRPIPQWFTDAKFGIFIHWGLYSVPSWATISAGHGGENFSEWYWWWLDGKKSPAYIAHHKETYGEDLRYQDFVDGFTCEMFDPAQWAELFKEAGARYVVLTSKHHEGYALWPSVHSWNWNSVDTGPHRDLAGDLSTAVKAAGLHMGFYYSLYEWFNPLYRSDLDKYVDTHMIPQMKDLVTRYEPDVVWPDGEWEHPSEKWKSTEFLAWLYNESPVRETVVVNDRWGKETRGKHGGYWTTEYGHMHSDNLEGKMIIHPWEECRGIGNSFGYNRNESLADYSTSERLVHLLIEKVSGGGNLLLNVGPTADGRIPVIMQQRLLDMGRWLKTNGEAIYGTSAWSTPRQEDIDAYFTAKGDDLYVIFTKYPGKAVTIRDLSGKAKSVTLLGSDAKVKYSQIGKNLTIIPPAISPAGTPGEYAWVFKLAGCLN